MSKQQVSEKHVKIHFLNFTFDFSTSSLTSIDGVKDLPPKPSQILHLLLSRPGELVTREMVVKNVWGNQVVDFDQNINFCIKQIRQSLDDDPRSPKFIETVPKKGYRFIASYELQKKKISYFNRLNYSLAVLMLLATVICVGWLINKQTNESVAKTYYASSEAEQAVKRAIYLFDQGGAENLQRAQVLFEKSISLDSLLADGHAGLALAKLYSAVDHNSRTIVRNHAKKALNLNSQSSFANLAMAKVSLYFDWDMVSAKTYFTKASNLSPDSILVLHDLAVVATILGEYDLAEASIVKALDIDPGRFQEYYHSGWFYQVAGKYEMALRQCVQSLEIEPNYHFSLLCAGRSAIKLELTQTAKHYLQEYMILYKSPQNIIDEVMTDLEKGHSVKFNRWYIEMLKSRNAGPFDMALAYGEIGETENALNALEKAIQEKNMMIPTAWAFDELKQLRGNKRFVELMEVVNRG